MKLEKTSNANYLVNKKRGRLSLVAGLVLTLGVIALSLPLCSLAISNIRQAKIISSTSSTSSDKAISTSTSNNTNRLSAAEIELPKGQIYTKGLGLSPVQMRLVNQGRFTELAVDLLNKVTEDKADRNAAWLTFAYLYLQKCDDANKLAFSFRPDKNNETVGVNLTLMRTFAFLCDKKLDLAEKELQKLPALAMDDAFVNYAFATLSGKQGKPQAAITYTKRAVQLAPDFAWGYRTIAFLEEKWLKQFNDAKVNYAKALAIEPKLSEASIALINLQIADNQYDQAIQIAQEAIAHNPRKSANYLQLANIYIQQWRLNEAAQQLKKAIAIEPDNSQYYRQLAFILQKEGKLTEAIDIEKKAIDHSVDKSADFVQLAGLQLANAQVDKAIESLKQAIEINPQNIIAISELTRVSIQTGKFDDLISELNNASAKFPKNEAIKIRLGDAYAAAKKIDKAIDTYKEAANLNSNDPEPHTKIAALLFAQKDFAGAAKEYTFSLNISSNSVPNLVALGSCEALMDDYLKAEAAFVTALALHQLTQPADSMTPPTRVDIIRGLAALLYKEGRYGDAAAQFMAVCEMDKNGVTAALNKFMTAQAIALRDRSKDSFKQLANAYGNLSADEKNAQRINYIDTLLRGNRYDEALALLNEIMNCTPSSALEPFYYICLSQVFLGKDDIQKAEETAKKAVQILDEKGAPHSDAYCQLGELSYTTGDLAEAEKSANDAIASNSKAFRAYVLLGNIALKRIASNTGKNAADSASNSRQQAQLAIEAANKAIEINPYYVDAYLLLGKAQNMQHDYKGALSTYNKAADLYPGLLQTHEALLCVLNKIGTKEEIAREEAVIASLKNKQ